MLNNVRVVDIDDDVENVLKERSVCESDEKYPKDPLDMYTEKEPAMERNEAILNYLPSDLYTTDANDKIPDNFKYPLALIQTARNQKQTNTGCLTNLLRLKFGAKIMLTVNIDEDHRLINSQTGIISHIEFAHGSFLRVYVKFSDEQVSSKGMRSSYIGRQNCCVFMAKYETEISIKEGSASPSIKCTQFPLTLT